MFYLAVMALVAVLFMLFSNVGMAMAADGLSADSRLFIAIACYGVSVMLLRQVLQSLFRYVLRVVTGIPSIRSTKSLVIGFVLSTAGVSVAGWSSYASDAGSKMVQSLAGDTPVVQVSKQPHPTKEKRHD